MTDIEILDRIHQGDERAIDFLYKKHYRMMIKMILKNSGTEDEARDIYQEALIVFWQKSRSGNLVLTSKISTFLYSICQNLWRKELDRKKKLSYETKDNAVFINHDLEEKIELVQKCMNELGESCRKVLTLYYFDDLSMDDIAKEMGFANADTAKTKKYKCKKELDQIIKAKYSEKDFLD